MSKEAKARIKINDLLKEVGWKFFDVAGVQSTGGEELSALMASVLDRAFKGEL